MLFNSFSFLLFFPIVALITYIVPQRFRYIWLLICSYYFYMNWNAKYAILLALSTCITYVTALLIEKFHGRKRYQKLFLIVSFASNLSILFFFKYIDFAFGICNRLMSICHISLALPMFDPILPVGISFYTFQALSYTADVYRQKVTVEKNPLKYALYVSFFPQLVAGPIERSGTLLAQINTPTAFPYAKARKGLFLMLLGYFEKIIIAERCSVIVNAVYDHYQDYSGPVIFIATVLFALQIYGDFSGYSHIAIGCAGVLGYDLMDNFHQPFFATTIQDHWRRWHISLSTWFRDYLYIPLGGSREGKLKKYRNIMITFLTSGLWHGASLHFVIWGGVHGLYQVTGELLSPVKAKIRKILHISDDSKGLQCFRILFTFLLICIAFVFFRAPGTKDSLYILYHIVADITKLPEAFSVILGLFGSITSVLILLSACIILFLLDYLHERGIWLHSYLASKPVIFRWICYVFLVLPVFLQAIYSFGAPASAFIYFQF